MNLHSACGKAAAVAWVVSIPAIAITHASRQAPESVARCSVATLSALKLEATTVRTAQIVAEGPASNGVERRSCRVQATVTTAADSAVNFEVWVPERWNHNVVVTGNAGYSNALSTRDMTLALSRRYAAVGGDTGHQTATPDDLLWGVDHSERIVDWGTRSIHAITGPAKRIAEQVGGNAIARSYFYGCSTGGHQGYAEIQRYPDDFDGVIAGAPGNNRVRLNVAFLWQFLANRRPHDDANPIIQPAKLPLITQAVVNACDGKDGVTDGVVDDPRRCDFDPAVLQCKSDEDSQCLTREQIATLRKMYAGARNPRTGEPIYQGWPKSSEALTLLPTGMPAIGWQQYSGGTEPARTNFWRHWIFNNPKWDWWSFDFDRDVATADEKVGRLIDQTNPDLGGFKASGGKAIVYHGWQDPVTNALDTISYYEQVRSRQGSQQEIDRFFRLFMVPGLGHCSGGTGATTFDFLSALEGWVERGVAPDRVVASKVENGATVRTRPLCPYPQRAVYTGTGSTDEAANFVCRTESPSTVQARPQVALTFDDLPSHGPLPPAMTRVDVAKSILATLREWKAPRVYGFINGKLMEAEPRDADVLTLWTGAGYPLGNHAYSHMDLHTNTADAFQADIAANEPVLGKFMPTGDWHWFRYPYLREGDNPDKKKAVTTYLDQHGYKVAQVTLSFGDYAWNAPYVRCAVKNDTQAIDELKASYLKAAEDSLRVGQEMAQSIFGRDIKHVMLLHIGSFETVMLPNLMELLKAKGFTLIPLDEAESDAAYKTEVAPLTRWDGTLLDQLIRAKGLKSPARGESPFPRLDAICR
jgi:peptidoglycan/xylan/chitin deacetylase (PgdA/CDA1 family)